MAQVEAAESAVVESLRAKGLLDAPVLSPRELHPLGLALTVVCNACGSIIEASWVTREESPRDVVLCVEKCRCDSPLMQDSGPGDRCEVR